MTAHAPDCPGQLDEGRCPCDAPPHRVFTREEVAKIVREFPPAEASAILGFVGGDVSPDDPCCSPLTSTVARDTAMLAAVGIAGAVGFVIGAGCVWWGMR